MTDQLKTEQAVAEALEVIGAIDHRQPADAGPWVNAPLSIVVKTVLDTRTEQFDCHNCKTSAYDTPVHAVRGGWACRECGCTTNLQEPVCEDCT
jgi:hypothetical protein